MIKVTWAQLKALRDSKSLNLQFINQTTEYLVFLVDNGFSLYTLIPITSPANSDQTDFQNNYLAAANQAIIDRVSGTIVLSDGVDNVKITSLRDLSVSDGLRGGGLQGALTLTTANTTYEAKVGASRLTNRKSLTIFANNDMFWGYTNTVTTSTGTPLKKNEKIIFSIDPDSTFQVWLVSATNSSTARITESP